MLVWLQAQRTEWREPTMSELIESLASITGHRDRDVLHLSLLGLMRDLLRPQSLAIRRAVGDGVGQRWLTRPRLNGDGQAMPELLPDDLELLPRLDEHPNRRHCLDQARQMVLPGQPHAMLVPLATDREVVGVLEIPTAAPMGADQRRVIGSMQRFYRHLHGLLDENERDSLTGLLNRKSFDETFLRAANRSLPEDGPSLTGAAHERRQARCDMPHWLAVVDIDHFKRVNDTHGHLIGDEVLSLLSGVMRSTFRYDDRLYRYGGEEFVVLTRCVQNADARIAFERLRATVEKFEFPQVGGLTISIGYTEVRPGDMPSSAVERAGQALYYAKQNGRNAACEHVDLVANGRLDSGARVGEIDLF